MSAEPLLDHDTRSPGPAVPRPAGVVDLAKYRGRTAPSPAAVPPPRPSDDPDAGGIAERSSLSEAVAIPAARATRPAPSSRTTGTDDAITVNRGVVAIRRVRLGSVFRMAFGLALCTLLVVVGAGVLIWLTISTLGIVENLESLAEDLGWSDVQLDGPAMLRAAFIGGVILAVAATFLAVVFAEIFNLLSTITGGLRAEVGPVPVSRRQRRRARRAERREARAAEASAEG